MQNTTTQNKAIVTRFNKEFLEQGDQLVFDELIAPDVINHSAPEGSPNGKNGMHYFLQYVLRKAFPDLKVEIMDQIAEGDKVTSRKCITGTHSGEFMGIPPTNRPVKINVIDIIRLEKGQYKEHWGLSNIPEIMEGLLKA